MSQPTINTSVHNFWLPSNIIYVNFTDKTGLFCNISMHKTEEKCLRYTVLSANQMGRHNAQMGHIQILKKRSEGIDWFQVAQDRGHGRIS